MSIPDNEQILRLLDLLTSAIADDLESQVLDFKPWRDSKKEMRVAVEYAVCFANAAGGVVVFGVADKTRGRARAIHGAEGYDVDVWKRGIFDSTRPNLTAGVEELAVPEGTGKLLIVRVPEGPDPPYGTAQGVYKRRVGKNCMPLDPQSFLRTRIQSGAVDWSDQPAEGVSKVDLDPVEIARARNILRGLDAKSELLQIDDSAFLAALGAVRGGRVTHTGLLLFGRDSVLAEHCPQSQVHYVYQVTETAIARNDFHRCGLLKALERIETVFSGPANPEQEVSVGFFKLRIPAFPLGVVREAMLNAVTHRDYSDPNEVLIRHTVGELVVVSPGGLLGGITPQNILRHEPVTRNRTLAEAFQQLRLVEKAGIGRRRIFMPLLEYGKQIPRYELQGDRVVLRIQNGAIDEPLARWIAAWKKEGHHLDLDALLILNHLRRNSSVHSMAAADLLQMTPDDAQVVLDRLAQPGEGFLERRGEKERVTFRLISRIDTSRPKDLVSFAHLRLDRDQPKALTRKYLAEIARSRRRRVLALVAYAPPGNAVDELAEQLRDDLDVEISGVAEINWLRLEFPNNRTRLDHSLKNELPRQLRADVNEPIPHLLRRHAPALAGTQKRAILWLDWGTFGRSHQGALTSAQLGEWLRFSSEFLGSYCPEDLRVVSYLALEVEDAKQPRLARALDECRSQPWSRRPEFRMIVLPPLGQVSENDLLDFLEDPGNSSCPPNLQAEVAARLIASTGGEFEATVSFLEEAERSSWYDLLSRLRQEQGGESLADEELS